MGAKEIFIQAMDILTKELGQMNTTTVTTMNNLRVLYLKTRQISEAGEILLQALQIKEATLGSDHPRALATVGGVGNLYVMQTKYPEAIEMYRKCLEGYQSIHGPMHKAVAESWNNLGEVAMKHGNFDEAEILFKQGLQTMLTISSGIEDRMTLYLQANIALVYRLQGRFEAAVEACKQIIASTPSGRTLGAKRSTNL